jgi:hypothetical protein
MVIGAAVVSALTACHAQGGATATTNAPEDAATCAARERGFSEFVAALPGRPVQSPTHVAIPDSTLGSAPGSGPLVEISSTELFLDGTRISEPTLAERVRRFNEWLDSGAGQSTTQSASGSSAPSVRALYVAASADLDVQTLRAFVGRVPRTFDLRLLVHVPAVPKAPGDAPVAARELARQLLVEPDPKRRTDLATSGWSQFSGCPAIDAAEQSASTGAPEGRWSRLQAALLSAIPHCDCRRLDTTSLRLLVSAEQRAGVATLGWLPLSFIRDERCDASMALRAMKKLVRQIEAFDAEFSGGFRDDAMSFDDVLVNDRLRVSFCDALPGETLAAKQRQHATLYLRGAGGDCEGWTFEPEAPGAPMGTWTRTAGGEPMSYYYWQAAEDLRVYGPADKKVSAKASAAHDFACEATVRLTGIDDDAIVSEKGRWFFDAAACRRSSEQAASLDVCRR